MEGIIQAGFGSQFLPIDMYCSIPQSADKILEGNLIVINSSHAIDGDLV